MRMRLKRRRGKGSRAEKSGTRDASDAWDHVLDLHVLARRTADCESAEYTRTTTLRRSLCGQHEQTRSRPARTGTKTPRVFWDGLCLTGRQSRRRSAREGPTKREKRAWKYGDPHDSCPEITMEKGETTIGVGDQVCSVLSLAPMQFLFSLLFAGAAAAGNKHCISERAALSIWKERTMAWTMSVNTTCFCQSSPL